jgi:HPt (histidine-containing phosphotransfer) domain-containing protein
VRGRPASYLRLLRSFVVQHGNDVEARPVGQRSTALQTAIWPNNSSTIRPASAKDAERLAHSLKGAAGALGLSGI